MLYWTRDYVSMLGLKLIHVSKRGPESQQQQIQTSEIPAKAQS